MNARKLVFVSLLGAGLALGCDQKPEGGAATASSSAKPAVASASAAPSASASTSAVASAAPSASAEPKKHHRPRFGMVGMYFRSASKLADLDEAQKTKLAEIEKGFMGPMEPPAEGKAYHDELVAQVKAGKIDNAKLEPLKAAAEKAMGAHRDKELDALNQLHALLKAPQRTALVAALKAKQGKHMGPGKDHPGMMGKPKDKVAHMTKELGLDDAQAKKVEAILPKDDGKAHDPEAWKKKAEAVQAAFEKDGFDAKKQELFTGKGMHGPMHGGMDSAFLEKLIAILKPEQREKLAANMAAGPGKHHKGPMMAPPAASGSASGAASGAPSNAPPASPGGDDDDD